MIVQHKKGDPAGSRDLAFIGRCRSYWAEDGWHDTETGKVVPAPALSAAEALLTVSAGPKTGTPSLNILKGRRKR